MMDRVPLCVDLDGTLIRTDMLHETLLGVARTSPLSITSLPTLLRGGKAQFKHLLAEHFVFDPAGLPYCVDVLNLIRSARAAGRPVVLATAASSRVANAIADNLGLFDEVLSSDNGLNLSGERKAEALVARYGEFGFDYIGNHRKDLPVLARARHGFLISSSKSLRRKATRISPGVTLLDAPLASVRVWATAIRVHQWLKNLLVLVPILAAQELANVPVLVNGFVALISFSLCASAIYIINDLIDLPADRAHRTKHRRPFASGALSISAGLAAASSLLMTSLLTALLLPSKFILVLGAYFVATTLYSFWLKRQIIVDVMLLAVLYTSRILAGSAATGIHPSFWLLAFSMFVFLCLAMLKRYSELRDVAQGSASIAGRGYMACDAPVILALGTGSGLVSVLVLALYTQSGLNAGAKTSEWLWLLPPLMLYWVARLWAKAGRGEVDDDPIVFAARDWQSLLVITLMAFAFLLSSEEWRPI